MVRCQVEAECKRESSSAMAVFFLQVLLHSANAQLAVRGRARSALQVTPRWRRVSNATAGIVSAIRRRTFTAGFATELAIRIKKASRSLLTCLIVP